MSAGARLLLLGGLLLLCLPAPAVAADKELIKQISFFTAVTGTLSLLLLLTWTLVALALYLDSAWPRLAPRIGQAQREHPAKCFLVGLINLAFLFVLTAAAGDIKPPLAVFPGILLILALLVGLASRGLHLGHRILRAPGSDNAALAYLAGIPVVTALSFIPFVGWFLFGPCSAAAGLGGAILGVATRHRPDGL